MSGRWKKSLALIVWLALLAGLTWHDKASQPPRSQQQETADPEANHQTGYSETDGEAFWIKTRRDPIAFFTLSLFVATSALVLVAVAQAFLFFVQLRYMRVASDDAKTAANAALETAEATKDANELNRRNFVSEQRPWLKLEVVPRGPLRFINDELTLTLRFQVTNVGHTVARNVWISPRLRAPALLSEAFNPFEEQASMIAETKRRTQFRWGFSIFPNDSALQDHTVSIGAEQMNKIVSEGVEFVNLNLIASVGYRTLFDEDVHQTCIMTEVRRNTLTRSIPMNKSRAPEAIFIDEGDIPENELKFIRSPLIGDYAD